MKRLVSIKEPKDVFLGKTSSMEILSVEKQVYKKMVCYLGWPFG
jgi:hypothetical protein